MLFFPLLQQGHEFAIYHNAAQSLSSLVLSVNTLLAEGSLTQTSVQAPNQQWMKKEASSPSVQAH